MNAGLQFWGVLGILNAANTLSCGGRGGAALSAALPNDESSHERVIVLSDPVLHPLRSGEVLLIFRFERHRIGEA